MNALTARRARRLTMMTAFLLVPWLSVPSSAGQAELYNPTIIVTDTKGQSQRLADSHFSYSHMNRHSDLGGSYLQVTRDKITSWVHLSQAKGVTFERKDTQVTVTLASGAPLQGIFPDRDLVIRGRGGLGDTEYKLADVRSFEVVQFRTEAGGSGSLISRAEGSARWVNARKTRDRWSITDGDATLVTGGFAIRDAYNDRTVTMFINDSRTVRSGYPSTRIKVRRGTSETDVDLLECCRRFEVTGVLVDGFPEITLTKKDGTTLTAHWLLVTRYGGEPAGFDDDDMLLWEVAYGYDAVPFPPLRRIVIHR